MRRVLGMGYRVGPLENTIFRYQVWHGRVIIREFLKTKKRNFWTLTLIEGLFTLKTLTSIVGIYDNYLRTSTIFLSRRMWLDRLLAGGALLRDLSWGFACPAHCGGSVWLPLFAGFGFGLLFGVLLSVLCWCYLFGLCKPLDFAPKPPHPSSQAGLHPSLHRRSRLSGYLHE